MDVLAQVTLPDGTKINNPPGFRQDYASIGDVLSSGFEVVIYVAGFLMVIWMFWGVFQYIFAGGAKEQLAKARARITYAIIGFVLVVMAFSISQFVESFAKPANIAPTQVVAP